MRNRVIVLVSVLVVFLAGFLPQFSKARRLENELQELRQDYAGADLRDLAGLAYFQATQKNYGLARDAAEQFFSRVREAAKQAPDAKVRKGLEDLAPSRDKVVAELAKGDAAAVSDLQDLFLRSRQATARRP